MTAVTLSSRIRRTVGAQEVYLREVWRYDWEVQPYLHCLEATWALSPTMPTATLEWPYGWIKREGTGNFVQVPKLDCLDFYVKVKMPLHSDAAVYRYWYGVVSHVEDTNHGIVTVNGLPRATGRQLLHCYGLERLLDTEMIAESWVDRGNASAEPVQLPVDFNARGRPNRNDRVIMPELAHVFEGQVLTPGGTLRPTAAWWSTRQIVEYLLAWAVPRSSYRTRHKRVRFRLYDPTPFLAAADRPTMRQNGQTVLAMLHRLIDRRRLRSFYLDVDETTNEVELVPIAWNAGMIDPEVPGADVFFQNSNTITLNYDSSQCTTSVLRKSRVGRYDRVIARGARRTSTATFYVASDCLKPAWTTAEEASYEAGFSGDAGYAALDDLDKAKRNAEVRARDELSAVYSWFSLPDDWAGIVQEAGAATTHPVFVDIGATGVAQAVDQYIHEVVFEPFIPLYEHVDYSTVASSDDPPVFTYRQPLVVFKTPTDATYVAGDKIATRADATADPGSDGGNIRWTAACRPLSDTRTLAVNVSGEPQHVIAETDFTPLADDRDLGNFDYRSKEMLITATVLDNRSAEGKYPEDGWGDGTLVDTQLGIVIYAGEEYRQDYLVPMTVVDVDDDGALVQTDGGYVRDDTDRLAIIARIAYEWWSQERIVLSLQTTDLSPMLDIGVLIQTIGDSVMPGNEHYETINTVISEVRISWPRLTDGDTQAPTMDIITGAGELDPMTIVPAPASREKGDRHLVRVRGARAARR